MLWGLPIGIWVAIFAIGILVVYLIYFISSAWVKEVFGDDEEGQSRNQPRDD